jgi:hypothetical protein
VTRRSCRRSAVALDRAIAAVSPRLGLRRFEQRVRLEAATRFFGPGQYTGARTDRPALKNWTPRLGGPNSDSAPDLPALRARSADLERNSPLATGAVHTIVTTTVGTGLKPRRASIASCSARRTTRPTRGSARRIGSSTGGRLEGVRHRGRSTFYQLQDLALRHGVDRGDAFGIRRFVERPNEVLATKLQLVEGDRVSTPDGQIETDKLFGRRARSRRPPQRYWVRDADPGRLQLPAAGSELDARRRLGAESGERARFTSPADAHRPGARDPAARARDRAPEAAGPLHRGRAHGRGGVGVLHGVHQDARRRSRRAARHDAETRRRRAATDDPRQINMGPAPSLVLNPARKRSSPTRCGRTRRSIRSCWRSCARSASRSSSRSSS